MPHRLLVPRHFVAGSGASFPGRQASRAWNGQWFVRLARLEGSLEEYIRDQQSKLAPLHAEIDTLARSQRFPLRKVGTLDARLRKACAALKVEVLP